MKKIIIFIPATHKEKVKEAMFSVGAGCYGDYEKCSFEVKGYGQFLPKDNASPFLGKHLELTFVEEYRVEMICEERFVKKSIQALRENHPYEEPAFDILELLKEEDFS